MYRPLGPRPTELPRDGTPGNRTMYRTPERRGRRAATLGPGIATLLVLLSSLGGLSGASAAAPRSAPHPGPTAVLSPSAASALSAGQPAVRLPAWTNVSRPGSPSPRSEFTMAYDPGDREVVLFGGMPKILGDTWTFANGTWKNITPAHSPPARYAGAMTYDAKDGYLLLFGGIGAHGNLNDTWAFSKGVWTNLTGGASPSPRFLPALAYDPPIGRVVLFGGCA